MEFDILYEEYLDELLEALLNERLQHNKRFLNVSIEHNASKLTIRWYGTSENPTGETDFTERVVPYNFLHIHEEIKRQYNKLRKKI